MTSVLLPKASLLAGGTPRVSQHKPRAGYRSSIKPKVKQALCVCQAEGREEADPGSDSSQQDPVDWRSFRAQLVALERQQLKSISAQPATKEKQSDIDKSHWVHQIARAEAGSLLIARHPDIGIFTRTVVLILHHGEEPESPVIGLILNLPTRLEVQSFLAEEGVKMPPGRKVMMGGPCTPNGLFALHSSRGLQSSQPVLDGIYKCDDMDVLAAAMNDGTLPPDKVRFFLGYAGWVVAQLAWEVEVGSWWVAAASSSLIRECMQGVGWQEDASNESDGMWHRLRRLLDVQSYDSPAPGMGDFQP